MLALQNIFDVFGIFESVSTILYNCKGSDNLALEIAYVKNGLLNVRVQDMVNLDRDIIARVIAKRMFENANRRIRNIRRNSDLISPAVADVLQYLPNGLFSVKGKSKEEILKDLLMANNFLTQSTSTVKGAKEFTKQFNTEFKELTPREKSKLWQVARAIELEYPQFYNQRTRDNKKYGSTQFANMIENKIREYRHILTNGIGGDLLQDLKQYSTAEKRETSFLKMLKDFQQYAAKENAKILRTMNRNNNVKKKHFKGNDAFKIEVEKL